MPPRPHTGPLFPERAAADRHHRRGPVHYDAPMPPHRLGLVAIETAVAMGQQVYERHVADLAPSVLGTGWKVETVAVKTLRSPVPGPIRLPGRLMTGEHAHLRRLAGALAFRGFDVVHRMDLRIPPCPSPEVLTIHDLAPWRFSDEGGVPGDARHSAQRAAAILCPTSFSASEVHDLFGIDRLHVVPYGVDEHFFTAEPLSDAAQANLGILGQFVLHAGGCTQRKNLAGLAEAWPLVRNARPGVELVLLGPTDPRRTALFAGLDGVHLMGRVDDTVARGLRAAASAVVVPSRYEGFGLPVLEGMAAGVPVVAAARSSLPEVCGDAALLVEPDGPSLAEGIITALDGGPEITAMVDRGLTRARAHTWVATAEGHAQLWRSLLA